ncbi:MAG: hypothetical protein O2900_09555 [Proteobacteria bacterium]|nr:hypothetical protein [Pseudomonadota bacterium]
MKKIIIVGVIFLASFGLVNNVFGQVAAPLITPGSTQINPAVIFWKESSSASVVLTNNDFKSGSQKVKGKSKGTEVSITGKLPQIGFGARAANSHTDYDDFSTSSYNYTDYYSDADLQVLQISSGAGFIAVGLGVSNVNGETNYKENSTSSYSKGESTSNTFGISLQFSEIYLGYFSGKDSSDLKTKGSSGERNYPKLNTNISGLGIGFLWRDRFDIHAEVFQLDVSAAKVEDSGSYYVNDESKTTGILLEIVTDLVNFGISYYKTNYKEEHYKDLLEDYDRETLSTALGFFFAENFNLSYVVTTDKYEQKYKTSNEVFTAYDASSSAIAISYIF